MYIIRPNIEEEEALDAVIAKFQEIITSRGGEIVKAEKWGRRKLAYEIEGFTDGFYMVVDFKAESAVSAELERVLKITDEVIRYLLVRIDE
jgi:small subunit ribosomal protein S6